MKRWISCALLVAAAACSKKGGGEPGANWSARPLASQAVTLGGVAFSIDLPKGMKEDPDLKQDSMRHWIPDQHDYFSEPGVMITVEHEFPASIDAAIADAMLDKNLTVTKQDGGDGSYLLTAISPDKGTAKALSWHKAGTGGVTCEATQAKTGGVPSPDATLAWLAKICRSVAAK